MSKEYSIEKITDILEIPESGIDDFLIDLKTYYELGRNMTKLIKGVAAVGGIDIAVIPTKMRWIDDKRHDATIHLVPKASHDLR